MAFSMAAAARAAPSISRRRADGWPAQPELDPSGYRTVVLMCESADRWYPNSPALVATASVTWLRWNRPADTTFLDAAASTTARIWGIIWAERARAVSSS